MAYIEMTQTGSSLVTKTGKILVNGISSHSIVPAGTVIDLTNKISSVVDGRFNSIEQELININNNANGISNTVIDLSTNLTTNYLSKETLATDAGLIVSAIEENTATFVTNDQLGQYYGLQLSSDVNGTKYITGFDIGAIVDPSNGTSDSYFRINADRFIIGGDLGDGFVSGVEGPLGEEYPAFSITQGDGEIPQLWFNGKVSIASIPEALNKFIGNFASMVDLNTYLVSNPDVIVNPGDSYYNLTDNVLYFWDGVQWVDSVGILEFRCFVFKRAAIRPTAPTGGNYSNPVPLGWSDGIPASDPTKDAQDPVWVSAATLNNKEDYTSNPPTWTEPEIMVDTETSDLMFNDSLTQPPMPTYTGDLTSVQPSDAINGWYNSAGVNAIWAAHRRKIGGVWESWYLYRIKGEDGVSGADGSRGSAILSGTSTTTAGFTSAFTTTFGNVINGDQYVSTSSSGTVIYTYNNGWFNNTTLTVHGDAVVDGTLNASKLRADISIGTAGYIYADGVHTSGSFQTSMSANNSQNAACGIVAYGTSYGVVAGGSNGVYANVGGSGSGVVAGSTSGNGVYSQSATGTAVYASSNSGGNGVNGVTQGNLVAYGVRGENVGNSTGFLGYLSFGVYTTDNCYLGNSSAAVTIEGAAYPFTGAHIVITKIDNAVEGDIVSVQDVKVYHVNQSYGIGVLTETSKDKKVFGVLNNRLNEDLIKHAMFSNIFGEVCHESEVKKVINEKDLIEGNIPSTENNASYRLKNIYEEYLMGLANEGYTVSGVNAIGEGGINVCEIGGDIENGDYICSSTVKGKGMKQDDDLLHNYTVAKALEDVVWAEETIGEGGCFEQDGYKYKMIACTYHCG